VALCGSAVRLQMNSHVLIFAATICLGRAGFATTFFAIDWRQTVYKYFCAFVFLALSSLAQAQDTKVVYHLNTGIENAAAALNNIKNHLDADPKTRLVVVSHGPGIDFLLQESKDSKGREFSASISALTGRGVEFRACNNTLTSRNIDPAKLALEAKVVPSGVAEVARLQAREGFAYLKP
jgi:intracellular sulfur oxidation DsrE/DsrF family protein